jgi:hypothetical protein
MLIQGAFMHVKDLVTADQFLKFLAGEAPAGHYFVAQPPPGIIMTAAIDWRVIIPDSEAANGLATALWTAYESMVMPLACENSEEAPAIFIQIKNLKGECDQFFMGKDVQKKDGFLHRVTETVAILSSKNNEGLLQEIANTSASDYWAQIG